MNLNQVIHIFDEACRKLVGMDLPLRDRLEAALDQISSIQEKDLNADLRKGYKKMNEKIRAYRGDPSNPVGQAQAALAILELCIFIHLETWQ